MREVDEYAQPGDDAAARAVRRVARDAVAGFVTSAPARPSRPPRSPRQRSPRRAAGAASAASMFRDLGRLLAMEGRSLNALRAALRIGARVTWQRLQEQARQGNGNPEAFARIGETVFWYMDELTASCSAGYAEARAELAGETSQLRRRLLDLLTSSPAAPVAGDREPGPGGRLAAAPPGGRGGARPAGRAPGRAAAGRRARRPDPPRPLPADR